MVRISDNHMFTPAQGRTTTPLTEFELQSLFTKMVLNRDKTIISKKGAVRYFINEVIFISASRSLWRMFPKDGGSKFLGHLENDMDTVKFLQNINNEMKEVRKFSIKSV